MPRDRRDIHSDHIDPSTSCEGNLGGRTTGELGWLVACPAGPGEATYSPLRAPRSTDCLLRRLPQLAPGRLRAM